MNPFKRARNHGTPMAPVTIMDVSVYPLGQVWLATPNRIAKVHIVDRNDEVCMVLIVDPLNKVERDTLYAVTPDQIVEVSS